MHATTDLAPSAAPAGILRGKHVLIVEDSGLLCCMLEELLRQAGCELAGPFTSLPEAMSAIEQPLHAALLDVRIRGELVSPLAERLERRGVPMLVTSAYRQDEIPRSLQGAAFLRKPFTEEDVLQKLGALLRSRPPG